MRGRLSVSVGVLLAALIVLAAPNAGAAATYVPYCYDLRTDQFLPATQWLIEPGTLTGTNGRDVLVGSYGADVINGLGGNDVICGSNVEPVDVENGYAYDAVYGGNGNDSIIAFGNIDGGSGSDIIDLDFPLIGEEYDPITVYGGTGNDILLSFYRGNPAPWITLNCGPGNDQYVAAEGTNLVSCEIEIQLAT